MSIFGRSARPSGAMPHLPRRAQPAQPDAVRARRGACALASPGATRLDKRYQSQACNVAWAEEIARDPFFALASRASSLSS